LQSFNNFGTFSPQSVVRLSEETLESKRDSDHAGAAHPVSRRRADSAGRARSQRRLVAAPALTPNPYGIPDQVVQNRAASAGDCVTTDMYAAVQKLYNASIGDDIHIAGDSIQSADNRLLHAGITGATVLSLVGGPESLGLKLAAKETLKGGLAQVTYHAIDAASGKTGGKLALQGGVKLSSDELKVGAELAGRGHDVIARPASGVGRTADFLVDGKPTELKTISNVKADSATTAVTKTIKTATKQAKNVIIDARNQRGLTEADGLRAVDRAFRETPKSALSSVQFLGRDGTDSFEFTVTRK
jgi:hypothetical protein